MGPDSQDPQDIGDLTQFPGSHYADPKFSWFDTVGPTALVFLNSPRLGSEYQNNLFVGDINNGNLYRFRLNAARDGFAFASFELANLVADNNGELQEVLLGSGFGGITDLKVGPDGLLYILSFGTGKTFVISSLTVRDSFHGNGRSDFDGDGQGDISFYRDGTWFILRSSDGGITTTGWGGLPQDLPIPRDYDGDPKVDVTIYRDGIWFIKRSSDGGTSVVGWGGLAQDILVPADYDGDGKTDIAVYRDGIWYVLRSLDGGVTATGWGGLIEDIPVPADYDGDGKADVAVYRNGVWFIVQSSDGAVAATGWGGAAGDIPLN
jgi:hypothetical protein